MSEASPCILLVEDDAPLRRSLAQWLRLNDLDVVEAATGPEALAAIERSVPDAVLTDMRMPGMNGLELLAALKKAHPALPVVMLSGHGDVPMAVAAMQAGAFNFLNKPYVPEQLVGTLRNALNQSELRMRIARLEERDGEAARLADRLVGDDGATLALRRMVADLAILPLDVLLSGETGSGKEVVARALHDGGPRRQGPFVAINCAALPADILESELFGHEIGAFTGASVRRLGKFEFADKGTIFLDEIESMPLAAQAKLLRVLQERRLTRLGSNKEILIDLRVVSATKTSLLDLAQEGRFRHDLYYRLAGAEIAIPPLRERGHDVVLLFERFASAMADRMNRPMPALSPDDISIMLAHPWPGNVRELKLLAERFALGLPWHPAGTAAPPERPHDTSRSLAERLADTERTLIADALRTADGSVRLAAEALQVPHRTLNEKIQRLGLGRPGASTNE